MLQKLTQSMIAYYTGDPKRIQHFLKVHELSALIGKMEGLSDDEQFTLEAAALVHDIGIKPAERLYGECGGKLQERLGEGESRSMLKKLGFEQSVTERVCYMVAHHHTYTGIDGKDLQILIEADFLVNLYEDGESVSAVQNAFDRIFRTESGRLICKQMFGL